MKRLLKRMSVFFGLLALVLVMGVIILTSVIQPNQYKPLIISEFKQFTGFDMTIPGDLSWSFFPHLGMEATEVVVSDPGVFSARLKKLVLRLRFIPLWHRQLDLDKVSIANLQINHLEASDVSAKIHLENQVLEIRELSAKLYQGKLNSETRVFLKETPSRLQVQGTLNQVDAAGFLQGLSGKNSSLQLKGSSDVNWNITTQGKTRDELLNHLNGQARAKVSKGSIQGLDLDYFIQTAVALISREPLPSGASTGETQFTQLTGTAIIKDGILTTEDLTLDSPLYFTKAVGSVNLVDKTLDYHLDVSSKISEKSNKLLALYGKTVPVRVSGDLRDPSVRLDTLALMKEVGREQLQKVGQEIQKALPDKANAFIKNLFH